MLAVIASPAVRGRGASGASPSHDRAELEKPRLCEVDRAAAVRRHSAAPGLGASRPTPAPGTRRGRPTPRRATGARSASGHSADPDPGATPSRRLSDAPGSQLVSCKLCCPRGDAVDPRVTGPARDSESPVGRVAQVVGRRLRELRWQAAVEAQAMVRETTVTPAPVRRSPVPMCLPLRLSLSLSLSVSLSLSLSPSLSLSLSLSPPLSLSLSLFLARSLARSLSLSCILFFPDLPFPNPLPWRLSRHQTHRLLLVRLGLLAVRGETRRLW